MGEEGQRQGRNQWADSGHHAGADEGVRGPMAAESGHGEISVFDGEGNENVVVATSDESGIKLGTGPSREAAMADHDQPGDHIGDGYKTGTTEH